MDLRKNAFEQGFLDFSPATTFVVSLALDDVGYLLKRSVTTEPLGLLTDRIDTSGFALRHRHSHLEDLSP